MTKSVTKVIYKPDSTSTHEYTVIVNPEENGTLLTLFSPAFTILHSSQGHQGFLGQPSNQQLDSDFGTTVDTDVVKIILDKGKEQNSDRIGEPTATTTNMARGRGSVELRSRPN
ncbi:hypothetical protein Hypma_012804 [Hypsizygus marmoreus]|uniref:Ribosome maturation protein SDO1/SBDS N-terminal domain-containing protein n=1 Tax=Hypsizygus marmoreus TaxID=39966 RepID=A0A369JD76_HYPMA|nr:hypothetical protein Hypma_012804 [Hypsizygus marmoreus]